MKQIYLLLISIFAIFFQTACRSEADERLNTAFSLAGDNKKELEKELNHYQNDPEKQLAARFLIMNMPGHSGINTSDIKKLQPVYTKYAGISQKHNWARSSEWQKEIDSLWKIEQTKISSLSIAKKQDIETVNADWLINEIDRSFKAWKENVYTQNDPFEDFCRYILPYRFSAGISLDASRDTFYKRHAHIFNDPDKDFRVVTDSLHQIYSDLMHNNWAAASLPIYNAATFEQIKRGLCDDKAWYNCLMMSALGMGIAIDFVPEWGNRSGGHSWNSLIVGGETYPFEPFWDDDRWKYKKIYNNEGFDLRWGKFRLPKVYRHTFEHHFPKPLANKSVERNDIPSLFRNLFMKDVSSQYFQVTDVNITITEPIPENVHYCYLCVFGAKEWQPVQWVKGGSLKGDYNFMTFENIPQQTIYRVKVKGTNDRIFTYKNGIIRWY